jgi:hypothetical protein
MNRIEETHKTKKKYEARLHVPVARLNSKKKSSSNPGLENL